MEDWYQELEGRCLELLQTVDKLLARYPHPRRRSGQSPAEKMLAEVLPGLNDLQDVLSEYRPPLLAMESALRKQMVHLNRQRIPPGPGLYRLKKQCQAMMLHMASLPASWTSPSVLVGSLRKPSQLEVCLSHNFYHVPASQIPEDRLPVDYVAIYQSRSLFPKDCGIRFYGRVKSCTPVQRWQITEIPKASDELYYRLEIQQWEQLECPISVREVPFTHLFTNLFLLTHSLETPELSLQTPAQYCHFQALRRAIDQGDSILLHHPGGRLRIKKSQIHLYRRSRRLAIYSTEAFLATPAAVFRQLMTILEQNAAKKARKKRLK